MGLQELWFILVAVLFLGFFVLEGFDFGVGMLMAPLGKMAGRSGGPEADDNHRRAVLNTIGPVWDGNEVWLITAGGAMFAAFPGWYATVFSGLFIPLLIILFSMILRVVAIEWRGKIDDPKWRHWADIGIAVGSWIPAILWGTAFAIMLRGLPVAEDQQVVGLTFSDVVNPYTLLGGLATCGIFLLHGVAFLALKTLGEVRDNALRIGRWLLAPVVVVAGLFGLWTQLVYGKPGSWVAFGIAVLALLGAVALLRAGTRDGWAFTLTTVVVVGVVGMLFIDLYPNLLPSTLNPDWNLTIYNASSNPYTLKVMTWAAAIFAPLVVGYQAWTYWVFRRRISAERIPASIGLPGRTS
ncbi:cytochrome D ubiquinol oxidase subunit II [Mycolicibacterium chitae]|uniref:Integral membrane cytochrome D ubiquinol oxidase (Subunit II) CydB n=1 Tax=Mycolicibacterium chitae TaxID=1792 RepID=A0A3S4T106_MYCCI|nr:cytochrome d ubiquinol oxidase subunit II [Mycolicibacterium chitae]MCV7107912.1 cytochrome d ubiquinol oxidase subunit II [Mycolicibacterium chitae]BBZ04594.1 cytochrome D ubiquinol oxidase subunit II [Mycolicibacterium chitae]VEG48224.1 integral membrane cytochrome D ubiquinol oxidase (Subunit II) CydB [Mycolicibacterium chitae]